jgi:hypothetical protein
MDVDVSSAEAYPEEIQQLAADLPMLGKKTGMQYLPLLTARGNELILYEGGNPVLKYRPTPREETRGVSTVTGINDGKDLSAIQSFIEKMSGGSHLVAFLGNDMAVARSIEFHFLSVGLYKGETCVYIFADGPEYGTPEDIKHQMAEYLRSNLGESEEMIGQLLADFHVYNVESALGAPDGEVKAAWRIIQDSLSRSGQPPYRLVVHVYRNISTREELRAHIAVERSLHDGISAVRGTVLCNHYRSAFTLDSGLFDEWQAAMLKSHHYAFWALDSTEASVLTRQS